MRRRTFVLGTAGALVAACQRQPPRATPTSTTAPNAPQTTTSTAPPQPPDWQQLSGRVRVVLPSEADYAEAKAIFNERFADSRPAAVVVPDSVDDVRAAVGFAAANGVPVAPRSGGHSYIGASATDGAVVIDLRGLAGEIAYYAASGAVTVPAAVDLDTLQTTLAAYGRLIPSGSCPTVGVAGLTLGGGLGADARSAGLTCDALESVDVVLPTGELVTASDDEHADLFWALRGGGGGNFGVVTGFRFRTSPAGDRDVVTMRFPDPVVADVVWHWHEWLAAADRSVWGMVNVPVGPGASGCTVVLATAPGAGVQRAGDLAAAIGTPALSTSTRTLGRLEFIHYFEGGAGASRPRGFVAGSDVIDELTPDAAQAIVAAARSWEGGGGATAVIESLSGAVQDVGPDGTAFPWRRHAACVQWYSEPTTPEGVDDATGWLGRAHDAVRDHSAGGYVNYLEAGTDAARYFGANLPRLQAARRAHDPDRVMGSGPMP